MKKFVGMLLMVPSLVLAGCSASTSQDETSQNTQSTSSTPALLQAVVDNAGSDDKALEAWKALLAANAESFDYAIDVNSEGEDYLFKEGDDNQLVDDNFIYDVGREAIVLPDDNALYSVDLTDINDSYDTLITGYGTIDRFESDPVLSAVSLQSTENDTLNGTLLASKDSSTSRSDACVDILIDTILNYGYVRSVNPIYNASLYNYELKQDGSEWKMELSIKDVNEFIKQASNADILIDNRTNRPVLVIDAIQAETYTFTFTSEGVIKEVENDIYHVINPISADYTNTYLNLLNKAEFEKADTQELKPAAFEDYFASILDGTLKVGDTFTISNWN